jgi:hypothetical protein
MELLTAALEGLYRCMQRFGPLLLVEILLPGGTLVALVLFFYRRRRGREQVRRTTSWQPHGQSRLANTLRCAPR